MLLLICKKSGEKIPTIDLFSIFNFKNKKTPETSFRRSIKYRWGIR
jgi:hypothetical protein